MCLFNRHIYPTECPNPFVCIKFKNWVVPKQQAWSLFVPLTPSFLGKSKACMQSLLNQKPANPITPFAMLGGKKENWKTYSCKKQKSNERAGGKASSSAQSQKALSPKKRGKKNHRCSAWGSCPKHAAPRGFDSPLSVRCGQISLLERQAHCRESVAETGQCCFLKATAHYHSRLQQLLLNEM